MNLGGFSFNFNTFPIFPYHKVLQGCGTIGILEIGWLNDFQYSQIFVFHLKKYEFIENLKGPS